MPERPQEVSALKPEHQKHFTKVSHTFEKVHWMNFLLSLFTNMALKKAVKVTKSYGLVKNEKFSGHEVSQVTRALDPLDQRVTKKKK